MKTTTPVQRDERTIAVQNAAYRWAYSVLAYALLIDVVCRSILRHEAAWDLLGLVIVGGAICTVYQARYKTLAHGWGKSAVLIAVLGAVIGAVVLAIVLVMTQVM